MITSSGMSCYRAVTFSLFTLEMRKYIIVLFLFSLNLALASPHWSTQKGLNQINMLKPLFDRLEDHDPAKHQQLISEVVSLAIVRGDSMALSYGYYRKARWCRLDLKYDSAIFWIQKAENYLVIQHKRDWLPLFWLEKGHIFSQQGDLQNALELFLNTYESAQFHGLVPLKCDALYHIGFVFYSHFKYDTAFSYFERSLTLARDLGDSLSVARSFNGMGLVAMRIEQYDLARSRFLYAVELINELGGNRRLLSKLYNNIGVTLEDQGRLAESIDYYNKSLEIKKMLGDIRGVASTIGNMADNFLAAGQLHKSLEYSLQGLEMAMSTSSKDFELSSYKRLWLTYKQLGDFEQSLKYHELFKALDDTISGEKAQKAINSQMAKAELSRQMNENELLKKEAFSRSRELSFQQWLTVAAVLTLALVVFLLYRVYQGYSQSRQLSLSLEFEKQKLEKANQLLGQVLNENKEMAGIMVHDLRSPLHRTLQLSTLLGREATLGTTQIEIVEKMQSQLSHSIKMINDLLFLEGPEQLEPDWIDLNHDLQKLVDSYAHEAAKKDIAIQFFPAPEEVLLYADQMVLHRVMDNLINNAIKFSPTGKSVVVKLRRKYPHALIYLKDEGPGFTEEDRKDLFKRFARLSARPTGQESSTGLGLAIVKRMVTQLGGEISLLEESGSGAVFELKIPLENGLVEV